MSISSCSSTNLRLSLEALKPPPPGALPLRGAPPPCLLPLHIGMGYKLNSYKNLRKYNLAAVRKNKNNSYRKHLPHARTVSLVSGHKISLQKLSQFIKFLLPLIRPYEQWCLLLLASLEGASGSGGGASEWHSESPFPPCPPQHTLLLASLSDMLNSNILLTLAVITTHFA